MKVSTLIQPQAEIVKVVTLRPGDVYKRLQEGGQFGGSDEIKYGVVTDVLGNGESSAISAIEYSSSYSGVTVEPKVFSGGRDIAIFPAQPIEFAEHMDGLVDALDRKIESLENDLAKQREIKRRVSGIKLDGLREAATSVAITETGAKVNDASPAWHEGQSLPPAEADGTETVEI